MSDPTLCCAECGALLPSGRFEGLCPGCLLAEPDDEFYPEPLPSLPELGLTSGPGLLQVHGFQILREINRGGMGIVYEALQLDPPRRVALKMLLPHLLEEPGMVERFRFEAEAMAELDHPGVLPVYQVGEAGDLPFFSMKMVLGGSLSQRGPAMAGDWAAIGDLIIELAEAVQYAHDHGVLHRDIKPGNVLFDETGRAFLTDFGLAKRADGDGPLQDQTRTSALLGTPNYLPPEWASGAARRLTTAGDIYGLGAVLYQLLTGDPPHRADQITLLLRRIADEEVQPPRQVRPDIPRDLEVICLRALDREPARRFPTAAALAADLRAWRRGRPIQSRPATRLERIWRLAKRNPLAAGLAASLAAALLTGGALLLHALQTSRAHLYDALVAQGRALRQSGQLGQKEEALDALHRAALLRPGQPLREEMISALSMTSLTRDSAIPCGGVEALTDPAFTRRTHYESDDRLTVRDLATGEVISRLPDDVRRPVIPGPFSPDGSLLVVKASGDRSPLRIWNCQTHTWLGDPPVVIRGRFPLFSPDGRSLAVSLRNGRVGLYDTSTGRLSQEFEIPFSSARLLAWSPDGKRLALAEHKGPRLIVMLPVTRELTLDRTLPPTAVVRCAAWTPDSATLLTGTENFKIYQWRFREGGVPRQFIGHRGNVVALACSPDGGWMSSQSEDGTTFVWNIASGQPEARLNIGGNYTAFSPDGRRLLCQDRVGGSLVSCTVVPSRVCRQISVQTPDLDETASDGCWAITFSPDGAMLSTGDLDGIAHFDTATGTLLGRAPVGYCWSLLWQADGSALFTASTAGGLQHWPAEGFGTGPEVALRQALPPLVRGSMNHAGLSRDGRRIALACLNARPGQEENHEVIKVFDALTGALLHWSSDTAFQLDSVAFNADASLIAASVREPGKRNVLLWNGAATRVGRISTSYGESTLLFSHAHGDLIIGDLHELLCLDALTEKVRWRLPRPERTNTPPALAQSADGRLLAANLEADAVAFIDAMTGRILTTLRHADAQPPGSLALSPDGSQLAVFGMNHVVQLWDLRTLRTTLRQDGLDWEAPPLPAPGARHVWRLIGAP